jgi:hypothetical protein
VGTLEAMMVLLVVGAAVLLVLAAGFVTIWSRRHRARRDLEGHFQNEWVNRERWASLADGDHVQQEAPDPAPIRTEP